GQSRMRTLAVLCSGGSDGRRPPDGQAGEVRGEPWPVETGGRRSVAPIEAEQGPRAQPGKPAASGKLWHGSAVGLFRAMQQPANNLHDRRILVCVGGGIAAYKACELVRRLRDAGAIVRVAMTENAQRFVSAASF